MAEVQDDDQWLYGEDGAERGADENSSSKADAPPNGSANATEDSGQAQDEASPDQEGDDATSKEAAAGDDEAADTSTADGDKSGDGAGGESSDEDDLTITIGELKKAAEVMTPGQQHQARFQPKAPPTSGLKDDDFATAGKVNGAAVADLNLAEYEDKPWRKPGADLTDYFNYGFNEQTWFKYCDRQKRMRMNESGSGLNSLGINVGKPFGVFSNSDSKSNGMDANGSLPNRPRPSGAFHRRLENQTKPEGNSIQVMTADRREYSNKVAPPFMSGPPPPVLHGPYDDMDFGGSAYGMGPDNGYYHSAPFFHTPPPGPPLPVSGPPPNFNAPPTSWNNPPPPMVPPPQMVPPATHDVPPPRWGGDAPPPSLTGGVALPSNSPPPTYRPDRDREESDEERRRSRRHRRTSRSPSRSRHRSRSRSRSPSHKHKRKKSKRDRDAE